MSWWIYQWEHDSVTLTRANVGLFILNHPGWWFQPTPLKNNGVKVRLDHHPNDIGEVIKFHGSSHHQPLHPAIGVPPFQEGLRQEAI